MEGLHGGFYPYIYSPARFAELALRHLQSQRCGICSAGPAGFAVPFSCRFPALRDLQCWKPASVQRFRVARPWIRRFSVTVDAAGSTVPLMVMGSRSVVCVSLIHSRVDGSDSTARSHTIWQYWGRRFLPPLPRRAYRWSPRRMNPRSWSVFNAVRTVRSGEFGDVDDGRDLTDRRGAVVVRAVRQVDEHGLRAGVADIGI